MIKSFAYPAERLLEHTEIHKHATGVEFRSAGMCYNPVIMPMKTFTLAVILR